MILLSDSAGREVEREKYVKAYARPGYGMGNARRQDAIKDLKKLGSGSYLDVSCGRGEMLGEAERLGFQPVQGTEIVPSLIDGRRVVEAFAHDLPFADGKFHVVTLFDVIEHLIPGDDELACRELGRVARRHIVITANNRQSRNHIGEELHINRRPYDEWDSLFRKWFAGSVIWLKEGRYYHSQTWRIDL